MAGSQRDGDYPNDPSSQFFDYDYYFGEHYSEPENNHDAEIGGPSYPRSPGRTSRFESDHEPVSSSEVDTISQSCAEESRVESLGATSHPATTTGNEPLRRNEQPSRIEVPNAELHHIEDELEEVELRLKHRELLKRRHELLQISPTGLQAETSGRSGLQDPTITSDSSAQLSIQGVISSETNQRSHHFPSTIVPFNNSWVDHSYDANISTSYGDPMQMVNAGVDFRYGAASTNPSYFGFANVSSNAHTGSSHSEALEQSRRAGAELPSLDSAHLLNNLPAGLPTFGLNHQYGMEGSIPALISNQNTLQPSLAGFQHGDGQNPLEPVSTSSLFQHDRPAQNSNMNMIIRKRPRSPEPSTAQRLSAIQNQLAKRTGVPEISLGVMCFNTEPQPKRSRTNSQKQNKKDVENIGGSCFLCLVYKKKCSRQRPCENCRNHWQKSVYTSTSFMWTCDVRSKLTDFNIFKYPLEGISALEIKDTINSQFGGLDTFTQQFAYLSQVTKQFGGIDALTQQFASLSQVTEQFGGFSAYERKFALLFQLTYNFEPSNLESILERIRAPGIVLCLYTYAHTIISWKRVLVYLVPELQHVLAFIERLYRNLCSRIFDYCDRVHRSPDKLEAVIVVVLTFNQIKYHTKTEISDPSVIDHLQQALQNRLKVFCSRIFGFNESKKVKWFEKEILLAAMMVDQAPELSCCLPPCIRNFPYKFSGSRPLNHIPFNPPAAPLGCPPCLLRRRNSNDYCYDNVQADSCCCGWVFDSTPPSFLKFFGHSAQSLARYIHFKPRKVSLEGMETPFDPHQALSTVFGGLWIADDLSLRKRKVIFGEALSFLLQHFFCIFKYVLMKVDDDKNRKIPEDELGRVASNFRPQVFAHILRLAVTMCHEFQNSEREDEIDAESDVRLISRLLSWASEKKEMINDYDLDLLNVILRSIKMEDSVSDDTNISSDEDRTADQLGKKDASSNEEGTSNEFEESF